MKHLLRILFVLLVFVSLSSCAKKEQTENFPHIECDSTQTLPKYDPVIVTLLDDNGKPVKDTTIRKIKKNLSIYIPCREYVYKAKFYKQNGDLLSNSQVLLMAIGKKWKYDATQDAAFLAYQYSDTEKKAISRYFKKKIIRSMVGHENHQPG